jgi:hypothetical protein
MCLENEVSSKAVQADERLAEAHDDLAFALDRRPKITGNSAFHGLSCGDECVSCESKNGNVRLV